MIIPHLAFLKFQLRLESPFSIMNICSPIFFLFYSSKVVKVGFRPLFSPVYNFDPLLHSTWLPESDNIQDNLRANGKGSKFGLVFLPPLSFLTFCLTTSIFSTPLFPLNEFTAVKVRGRFRAIAFHSAKTHAKFLKNGLLSFSHFWAFIIFCPGNERPPIHF